MLGVIAYQFSAKLYSLFLTLVGQETEMADLHETGRKHMKKESPDEFSRVHHHQFDCIVIFSVSVVESDHTVLTIHYAVIRYGHPVCISANVVKDLLRPCKGLFGEHHPVLWVLLQKKEYSEKLPARVVAKKETRRLL